MTLIKKQLLTSLLLASTSLQPVLAEDIKLGILFGFTGSIESVAANMEPAAELAIKEVSDSGAFLEGAKVSGIRADSTCADAAAATAALSTIQGHGLFFRTSASIDRAG